MHRASALICHDQAARTGLQEISVYNSVSIAMGTNPPALKYRDEYAGQTKRTIQDHDSIDDSLDPLFRDILD